MRAAIALGQSSAPSSRIRTSRPSQPSDPVAEGRHWPALDSLRASLYSSVVKDTTDRPITFELLNALHGVEAQLEGALEPLGLSLAKFGLLSNLAAAGEPLSLGALADRCSCVRSNITQLVDRLEAEGLVTRADDPADRRSIRAELTAKGRAQHAAGVKATAKIEQDLLSRLAKDQRGPLVRMLRSLADCR